MPWASRGGAGNAPAAVSPPRGRQGQTESPSSRGEWPSPRERCGFVYTARPCPRALPSTGMWLASAGAAGPSYARNGNWCNIDRRLSNVRGPFSPTAASATLKTQTHLRAPGCQTPWTSLFLFMQTSHKTCRSGDAGLAGSPPPNGRMRLRSGRARGPRAAHPSPVRRWAATPR